jgi:hypothetical protein
MSKVKPFPRILIFFFAATLLLLGYLLSRTFFMNIIEVEITGNTYYSDREILEASGIYKWQNSNKIKYDKLEKKMLEKLVKTQDIAFEKKMSGLETKLIIKITDCKPAFAIDYMEQYFIVNSSPISRKALTPDKNGNISEYDKLAKNNEAKIFDVKDNNSNLIIIEGFQPLYTSLGCFVTSNNDAKDTAYNRIIKYISKSNMPIKSVNLKNVFDIKINYDNRIECQIGASTDFLYKLNYIREVVATLDSTAEGYLIFREGGEASFISKIDWENYQLKLQKFY